jgi:hypothetical protein
MREVMQAADAGAMLDGLIQLFSNFWAQNRLLLKRIHGIAAVDPEFGKAIKARNQRRQVAATRVIDRVNGRSRVERKNERVATLVALTSFEFFDAFAESLGSVEAAQEKLPELIRRALDLER